MNYRNTAYLTVISFLLIFAPTCGMEQGPSDEVALLTSRYNEKSLKKEEDVNQHITDTKKLINLLPQYKNNNTDLAATILLGLHKFKNVLLDGSSSYFAPYKFNEELNEFHKLLKQPHSLYPDHIKQIMVEIFQQKREHNYESITTDTFKSITTDTFEIIELVSSDTYGAIVLVKEYIAKICDGNYKPTDLYDPIKFLIDVHTKLSHLTFNNQADKAPINTLLTTKIEPFIKKQSNLFGKQMITTPISCASEIVNSLEQLIKDTKHNAIQNYIKNAITAINNNKRIIDDTFNNQTFNISTGDAYIPTTTTKPEIIKAAQEEFSRNDEKNTQTSIINQINTINTSNQRIIQSQRASYKDIKLNINIIIDILSSFEITKESEKSQLYQNITQTLLETVNLTKIICIFEIDSDEKKFKDNLDELALDLQQLQMHNKIDKWFLQNPYDTIEKAKSNNYFTEIISLINKCSQSESLLNYTNEELSNNLEKLKTYQNIYCNNEDYNQMFKNSNNLKSLPKDIETCINNINMKKEEICATLKSIRQQVDNLTSDYNNFLNVIDEIIKALRNKNTEHIEFTNIIKTFVTNTSQIQPNNNVKCHINMYLKLAQLQSILKNTYELESAYKSIAESLLPNAIDQVISCSTSNNQDIPLSFDEIIEYLKEETQKFSNNNIIMKVVNDLITNLHNNKDSINTAHNLSVTKHTIKIPANQKQLQSQSPQNQSQNQASENDVIAKQASIIDQIEKINESNQKIIESQRANYKDIKQNIDIIINILSSFKITEESEKSLLYQNIMSTLSETVNLTKIICIFEIDNDEEKFEENLNELKLALETLKTNEKIDEWFLKNTAATIQKAQANNILSLIKKYNTKESLLCYSAKQLVTDKETLEKHHSLYCNNQTYSLMFKASKHLKSLSTDIDACIDNIKNALKEIERNITQKENKIEEYRLQANALKITYDNLQETVDLTVQIIQNCNIYNYYVINSAILTFVDKICNGNYPIPAPDQLTISLSLAKLQSELENAKNNAHSSVKDRFDNSIATVSAQINLESLNTQVNKLSTDYASFVPICNEIIKALQNKDFNYSINNAYIISNFTKKIPSIIIENRTITHINFCLLLAKLQSALEAKNINQKFNTILKDLSECLLPAAIDKVTSCSTINNQDIFLSYDEIIKHLKEETQKFSNDNIIMKVVNDLIISLNDKKESINKAKNVVQLKPAVTTQSWSYNPFPLLWSLITNFFSIFSSLKFW